MRRAARVEWECRGALRLCAAGGAGGGVEWGAGRAAASRNWCGGPGVRSRGAQAPIATRMTRRRGGTVPVAHPGGRPLATVWTCGVERAGSPHAADGREPVPGRRPSRAVGWRGGRTPSRTGTAPSRPASGAGRSGSGRSGGEVVGWRDGAVWRPAERSSCGSGGPVSGSRRRTDDGSPPEISGTKYRQPLCPWRTVVKLACARSYRPLPPWQAIGARTYLSPCRRPSIALRPLRREVRRPARTPRQREDPDEANAATRRKLREPKLDEGSPAWRSKSCTKAGAAVGPAMPKPHARAGKARAARRAKRHP
jgi:hypothetical protein